MPIYKRSPLANFSALWVCTVLASGVAGALINTVNGWVCPSYFYFLLPLDVVNDWTSSAQHWYIAQQGWRVGYVSGLFIATTFSGFVFVASVSLCPFELSCRFLPKILLTVILFWYLGGLNGVITGVLMLQLSPLWISAIVMPNTTISPSTLYVLKWLWVGGSIWGAYFGALVALIRGCISFNRTWQKMKTSMASDTAAPE